MIDLAEESVKHTEHRLLPIKKLCEDGPQAFWLSAISLHTHKIVMSLKMYANHGHGSMPKCLGEMAVIIRREDLAQKIVPGLNELSMKKRWELLKRHLWSIAESIRECQDELQEYTNNNNLNLILSQHLECLEEVYEHLCKQGRKEFGVS